MVLHVWARGMITLLNVEANDNIFDGGARLDNTGPIIPDYIPGVFNVNVTNCQFSRNKYTGLRISTHGQVSISKVHAEDNINGNGAHIENYEYETKSVTISGTEYGDNIFSGNGKLGLRIYTYGAIVLNYVNADNNLLDGAQLENWEGTRRPVTISNSSFSGNTEYGLLIESKGAITLKNVIASENIKSGMDLQTYTFSNSLNQVSISSSDFNYNHEAGFRIYAMGAVSLNNVIVDWNLWGGRPH